MPHLGVTELLIVLAIILVLFGAKKVPEMARGLGQGMRELKRSLREEVMDEDGNASVSAPAAPARDTSPSPIVKP
jgi:sec-independent protein translocase protein TatA